MALMCLPSRAGRTDAFELRVLAHLSSQKDRAKQPSTQVALVTHRPRARLFGLGGPSPHKGARPPSLSAPRSTSLLRTVIAREACRCCGLFATRMRHMRRTWCHGWEWSRGLPQMASGCYCAAPHLGLACSLCLSIWGLHLYEGACGGALTFAQAVSTRAAAVARP